MLSLQKLEKQVQRKLEKLSTKKKSYPYKPRRHLQARYRHVTIF